MKALSVGLSLCFASFSCVCAWSQLSDRQQLEERRETFLMDTLSKPPRFDGWRDVYRLLDNRSIRDEIRFPYASYLRYRQVIQQYDPEYSRILALPKETPTQYKQVLKAELLERTIESIEGLFDSHQRERLDQLVHYVEIAYVGLNNALADGRLGATVGVTDNQKTWLRSKGQEILKEADARVLQLRAQAHDKILNLLSPEQQELANRLLGKYFGFIDGPAQLMRDQNKDFEDESRLTPAKGKGTVSVAELAEKKGVVLAHDNSKDALFFSLLQRSAIRQELGLTDEQYSAYLRFSQRRRDGIQDSRVAPVEVAYEILLPEQQERLRQIAWYQAINSRGYASAISQGALAVALAISNEQKPKLFAAISRLEEQRDAEILTIRGKAHDRILLELSTEQQKIASELLGSFFIYVDGWIAAKRELYEPSLETDRY